jgi:hypothetical protein
MARTEVDSANITKICCAYFILVAVLFIRAPVMV